MTKNKDSNIVVGNTAGLKRASELFDQSISVLAKKHDQNAKIKKMDGSIPSLLEQCNEKIKHIKEDFETVFFTPGLERFQDNISHSKTFLRLPEVSSDLSPIARKEIAQIFQREAQLKARKLVVLSSTDDPEIDGVSQKNCLLFTLHPWVSFNLRKNADGRGLETFCEELLKTVSNFKPSNIIFLDKPLAPLQIEKCNSVLGKLHAGPASLFPTAKRPKPILKLEPINGGHAYKRLCKELKYDPQDIGEFYSRPNGQNLDQKRFSLTFDSRSPTNAAVTWILPKIKFLSKDMAQSAISLVNTLDFCLSSDNFVGEIEEAASKLNEERATLLLLLSAAHFSQDGNDNIQALACVATAIDLIPEDNHKLSSLAATIYLELGQSQLAIETLAQHHLDQSIASTKGAMNLKSFIHPPTKHQKQHGHSLLIDYLHENGPYSGSRKRVMVEVGTTRESLPAQSSTRKLGMLSLEMDLDFVTVDMDPVNSRRANNMFRKNKMPFKAVTAKGEDFLAEYSGLIDFVFLDAYDFDHGNHSEIRQARYTEFLGDRINEQACHKMHLDCAKSLIKILSDDGVICFDDTWLDDNKNWTAKGATAVPFLLDNGFELIAMENRAAILRRKV